MIHHHKNILEIIVLTNGNFNLESNFQGFIIYYVQRKEKFLDKDFLSVKNMD